MILESIIPFYFVFVRCLWNGSVCENCWIDFCFRVACPPLIANAVYVCVCVLPGSRYFLWRFGSLKKINKIYLCQKVYKCECKMHRMIYYCIKSYQTTVVPGTYVRMRKEMKAISSVCEILFSLPTSINLILY